MSELPRIDPSWTRTRPAPPKDHSITAVILLAGIVLLAGLRFARSASEFETARDQARKQSQSLAATAHLRQAEAREVERPVVHYIPEAQAARKPEGGIGSSIGDKSIHRCVYAGGDTYQLGACKAPWVDARYVRYSSRQQNVADQAAMIAQAEAKLRAEERRFAALAGQQAGSWQPGYAPNPAQEARQRCASAKAQRDEAYRVMGNNRTFDFIRHWNDFVFDACKNT